MTIHLSFRSTVAGTGYYEYALVKYERSTSVPVIGTDPVPTSADIATGGLQREIRSMTPGYLIKYGQIAITPQTTKITVIKANWAKYKKALVRDGDYYCLVIFNRSDGASFYDVQTRYKTYSVR